MAASYQLVPMNMELIPQIAELERQCFSKPWTEAMLAEELDNLTASFLSLIHICAADPAAARPPGPE